MASTYNPSITGGRMQSKFQILDSFLHQHQVYWRSEPFHLCQQDELPWRSHNQPLFTWLQSLSNDQVLAFKEQPASLIEELNEFFPVVIDAKARKIGQPRTRNLLPKRPFRLPSHHFAQKIRSLTFASIMAPGSSLMVHLP